MQEEFDRLELGAAALLELPDEVIHRILATLDGVRLARLATTCKALRLQADEQAWHAVSHSRWGWLFKTPNTGTTWRGTYAKLHRLDGVHFCVLGGIKAATALPVANSASPCGLARALSIRDGQWRAINSPTDAAREMPAVVRAADGALVVMGGTSFAAGSFETLRSVERCAAPFTEWQPMTNLATPRCCCGAAADETGAIYCVGGGESMYRGESTRCLHS